MEGVEHEGLGSHAGSLWGSRSTLCLPLRSQRWEPQPLQPPHHLQNHLPTLHSLTPPLCNIHVPHTRDLVLHTHTQMPHDTIGHCCVYVGSHVYTYKGTNSDSNAISSHSKALCYMAPGTALSVSHTQLFNHHHSPLPPSLGRRSRGCQEVSSFPEA